MQVAGHSFVVVEPDVVALWGVVAFWDWFWRAGGLLFVWILKNSPFWFVNNEPWTRAMRLVVRIEGM